MTWITQAECETVTRDVDAAGDCGERNASPIPSFIIFRRMICMCTHTHDCRHKFSDFREEDGLYLIFLSNWTSRLEEKLNIWKEKNEE